MEKQILITGASGLLGRALVRRFVKEKFTVFAQYHKNRPENIDGCEWIAADFSTPAGIRDFLIVNSLRLKHCSYLVNNYGPITDKRISELTTDDFYFDFHHNVITAFELTDFFLKYADLRAVINIGFEDVGVVRPYKKILSYAAAKNALQLITTSFDAEYEDIRFHMVSPPTMEGARVKAPKGNTVPPDTVADEIYELITANPG